MSPPGFGFCSEFFCNLLDYLSMCSWMAIPGEAYHSTVFSPFVDNSSFWFKSHSLRNGNPVTLSRLIDVNEVLFLNCS